MPTTRPAAAGVLFAWLLLKYTSAFAWVVAPGMYGDTDYYFHSVRDAVASGSIAGTLREYPPPVAWLLEVPYLLGGQTELDYRYLFMICVSVVDLVFVALLLRRLGAVPALFWILLSTMAGQLALLRFDVVPAVLAASALLLLLTGRTPLAAGVVALGTATKLWPILLAPLLGIGRRERLKAAGVFGASGLVLAGIAWLAGGWDRLTSPLTYQSARGLQIEAVAALPLIRAWPTDPSVVVSYTEFKAFEVTGPGSDALLRAASAASVLAVVVGAVLVVAWYLLGCPREAAAYLALSSVGMFVVTSRALSPQYMLWLGAMVVVLAGLALVEPATFVRWSAVATASGFAVLQLLTSAVYPTFYDGLNEHTSHTAMAVRLLTGRNIGLVVWLAFVLAYAVTSLARGRRAD